MARPLKQGMDYFPHDVDLDMDDKLSMIIGEFGHKGEYAYTKLLCWIYKNDGYFCEWKEDVQLKFMRRYTHCGFSLSFILELVPRCVKWGLFDQAVFDAFQILTSERIQETWLDATRKRSGRTYIPKYWLIKVNAALQPEETGFIPEVIDKLKKTKLNESKGVLAPAAPPIENSIASEVLKTDPPEKKNAGAKKFIPPELQEIKDYFLLVIGNPKKSGHWPADVCENEAGKFLDHYKANGWKQGKGKPIVDWNSACHNWIRNKREGAFSGPTPRQKTSAPLSTQKPQLSNIEKDINYLYETYCEFPKKYLEQLINIDVKHYDFMKTAGLISFGQTLVNEIKIDAGKYMADQDIQNNEVNLLKTMKKFGVHYLFKQYAVKGKEAVF